MEPRRGLTATLCLQDGNDLFMSLWAFFH